MFSFNDYVTGEVVSAFDKDVLLEELNERFNDYKELAKERGGQVIVVYSKGVYSITIK